MNRLKQNPNTGAEDTGSETRADSRGSEEPQGSNAIVETRCDVTRNPVEKSNYFLQGAVALALLSLALNVALFQSLMAMKTANQIQIKNLKRDLLNQEGLLKKDKLLERMLNILLALQYLNTISEVRKPHKFLSVITAEHELKRVSAHSPHEEIEAKLDDLRWIRDLINWYNTEFNAKLSNWLLRLQEAENIFESNGSLKSLESQERAMNELMDDEQLFSFADVLFDKAKYTEAMGLYENIFKRRIVSLGTDHYDTLNAQHRVARCLFTLGKYSKALHLYRFVYHKWSQTLGPDHSRTLTAQHNVAVTLSNESKYADALRIYEQVLKKQVSTLGENDASTKLTKSNMAIARQNLGMR